MGVPLAAYALGIRYGYMTRSRSKNTDYEIIEVIEDRARLVYRGHVDSKLRFSAAGFSITMFVSCVGVAIAAEPKEHPTLFSPSIWQCVWWIASVASLVCAVYFAVRGLTERESEDSFIKKLKEWTPTTSTGSVASTASESGDTVTGTRS